jgi:uncharacterized membrane protein YfcA
MFLFSSASRVESLALTCKCAQGRNECRDDRPRHPLHRRDVGGVQNALAGGGSFITLPSLMLSGMDARAANITSTVALFPAQLVTGFTGRADAGTPTGLTTRRLFVISLVGGALGELILLATPPSIFAHLVPWLVLLATALFAWGSFFREPLPAGEAHLSHRAASVAQFSLPSTAAISTAASAF